jgi:hypothetical protein
MKYPVIRTALRRRSRKLVATDTQQNPSISLSFTDTYTQKYIYKEMRMRFLNNDDLFLKFW